MLKKVLKLLLLMPITLLSCQAQEDKLETVPQVDLARYAGKWYEIASYPQKFQKGCEYTMAEYTLSDEGYVIVENSCLRNGKTGRIKGKARVVKNSGNAKLKVSFFWPFSGDYWIIDLAPDYRYAVVSSPGKNYLWILSRSKTMNEEDLKQVMSRLKEKGFILEKLKFTRQ